MIEITRTLADLVNVKDVIDVIQMKTSLNTAKILWLEENTFLPEMLQGVTINTNWG